MWTLILVFGWTMGTAPAAIVVPNFKTLESCMVAQKALIEQARRRTEEVRLNMCVKGE